MTIDKVFADPSAWLSVTVVVLVFLLCRKEIAAWVAPRGRKSPDAPANPPPLFQVFGSLAYETTQIETQEDSIRMYKAVSEHTKIPCISYQVMVVQKMFKQIRTSEFYEKGGYAGRLRNVREHIALKLQEISEKCRTYPAIKRKGE